MQKQRNPFIPLWICCFLGPKCPRFPPARFARRIASFPYGSPAFAAFDPKYPKRLPGTLRAPDCCISFGFYAFGPKYPQNFPGALRAPDCFIFLCFCCFLTPNTPKKSRRASRAGLLHFPMFLLLLDPKYPKIFPARFARRIASFSYGFACFGPQIPPKIPGALRAPDCLISYGFCIAFSMLAKVSF